MCQRACVPVLKGLPRSSIEQRFSEAPLNIGSLKLLSSWVFWSSSQHGFSEAPQNVFFSFWKSPWKAVFWSSSEQVFSGAPLNRGFPKFLWILLLFLFLFLFCRSFEQGFSEVSLNRGFPELPTTWVFLSSSRFSEAPLYIGFLKLH